MLPTKHIILILIVRIHQRISMVGWDVLVIVDVGIVDLVLLRRFHVRAFHPFQFLLQHQFRHQAHLHIRPHNSPRCSSRSNPSSPSRWKIMGTKPWRASLHRHSPILGKYRRKNHRQRTKILGKNRLSIRYRIRESQL